jgi:hypothetical protein
MASVLWSCFGYGYIPDKATQASRTAEKGNSGAPDFQGFLLIIIIEDGTTFVYREPGPTPSPTQSPWVVSDVMQVSIVPVPLEAV